MGAALSGSTRGLYKKYGDRLLDTPLSETAFVGAAIGAATCGMRPVAELMFIDFLGVCFDQIFNQAGPSFRYMFRGARRKRRSSFAPCTARASPPPPSTRRR